MALKPARLQWSDTGAIESLDYGDVYFQRDKGMDESRHVFIENNNLAARFAALHGSFSIAETGFGSGLNFLLAAKLFLETAPPDARLIYASVEKHPITKADLARVYEFFGALAPLTEDILRQYPPLIEGFHTLHIAGGRIQLMLMFGDIAQVLPQLQGKFDCWFLDGFSPVKNPDMWQDSLYALVAARTKAGGTLSTFSSAGHVRRGLKAAGFEVKKIKGFGFKWSMTIARMPGDAAGYMQKKVAVLGAGIAGCAAAYALQRRGHVVTLIDHKGIAAETSGNPVGIVYPKLTADPSHMGAFHAHAFSYTANLLKILALPSWQACGVLHLDLNADDAARSKQTMERHEFPADYAVLTDKGILQPGAGFLSPVEFCTALSKNVETIIGTAIGGLEKKPDGWHVKDTGGKSIAVADAVVIALGNASLKLMETKWLPLQSFRGQVTLVKETAQSASLDKVICHDGYITPAVDGIHCIGATFQKQEAGDFSNRAADDAENLQKLNANLPQFGFTESDITASRSGYRAATPDKIPMIGPCPDYDGYVAAFAELRRTDKIDAAPVYHQGLYVSTGFGAHGMTGAPLAGEMIAAMISGDPCPVPLDVLEHAVPERFILRGLKRRQI